VRKFGSIMYKGTDRIEIYWTPSNISRFASAFIKFKHGGRGKMCEESITDEENDVKKNRREVSKLV